MNPSAKAGAWAVLLLLAVLPYAGTLRSDFTYAYDDKALIFDNPYVHNFRHLREVLTTPLWANRNAQQATPYYRPVAMMGFLLCYQLFGPWAYGFHLASVLLNAAAVLVLFALAEQIFGSRVIAFAAAGLFALHPIHVEAVAWISAVTDVEVTFFYLLALWCYLKPAGQSGGRQLWALAAMIASFAIAIFSKEQALTLPVLAMIYEHFYRGDRGQTTLRQKLYRYGPLWLVSLGYLLLRWRVLGVFAEATRLHQLTTPQVFLSALALVGEYFNELLLPLHLSAFHAFRSSTSLLDLRVLWGALVLIISACGFAALWKRARPASLGILWLFLSLAPVLNARWMSFYVLGERYLYLPSAGFCLTAGWACAILWRAASKRRLLQKSVLAAGVVFAVLCSLRIAWRVSDWRDDVTLYARALADDPSDFRLHDALGLAYWFRGQIENAEREWHETLRLEPNSIQTLDLLGALYSHEKRFDLAVPLLERSVLLYPKSADTHLNLGAAYAQMGNMPRAEEQFRAAVLLFPLNFNAHNLLGKLYFDSGRFSEAEQQFRESLECEPNVAAYDHLGYIDMQRGDHAAAEKNFQAALALNPQDNHAHYNLGLIYAAAGRSAQAESELRQALAADPGNSEILAALEKLRR